MLLKINHNMELKFLHKNEWIPVDLKPCFPNSYENDFFSIRNRDGEEVYLIENILNLEEVDQNTIKKYLEFKTFKFRISGIYKVEEDFGVRHFEVKTFSGDRNFQTNLDDWPKVQKNGNVCIEDIFGDQYFFSQLEFGESLISDYIA